MLGKFQSNFKKREIILY